MSAYIGTRIVAHARPAVGGETGPRAEMIRASYRGMGRKCHRQDNSDKLPSIAAAIRRHVGSLYLPRPKLTPEQKRSRTMRERAAAARKAAKR